MNAPKRGARGRETEPRAPVRSGSPTFFGLPACSEWEDLSAQVAILGVPYDGGINDRPGARFGPLAIREASLRFPALDKEGWYDVEAGRQILRGVGMVDAGDVDIRSVETAQNFARITQAVGQLLALSAFPVLVGGDHSITYPVVLAFAGRPLRLVQFDAHMDFTDEWHGQRYSHDNQMRRAIELPHVDGLTQIGVRGLFERLEPYQAAQRSGVAIVTSQEVVEKGPKEALAGIALEGPCYVTIDIDVLDPGIAPGTGFPEPGGLSYYQLRDALQEVARRAQVVGFDLTEVSPPYDGPSQVTARIAARLILDFLGAIFPSRE